VFRHDRRFGVRGIPTHAPPPPRSPRGLGPAGGNEGRTAGAVARDVARPYGRIGTCPARDNPVKGGGILQWLPHGNPDRPFSGTHAPPGAPGCPSNKGGCRRSRAKCFASNAPGASAASRSDSSPQPDCSDRAVWKDVAQRFAGRWLPDPDGAARRGWLGAGLQLETACGRPSGPRDNEDNHQFREKTALVRRYAAKTNARKKIRLRRKPVAPIPRCG
jgi:hypothetical protein